MARIPKDELERLKRKVNVAELARMRGVELTAVGSELRGHCPFHDDSTPSFFVHESTNVWNCRGACDAGGSVVDFVMRSEGIAFRHAMEWLRGYENGEVTPSKTAPVKTSTARKLASPFEFGSDEQALLNRYAAFCHEVFKRTPAAQGYLEKRGLQSSEMVEKFQIGFVDRSLGLRLPNNQRVEGRQMREQLHQLGVLRESGHEHLVGCITFPVVDEHGNVRQIYGRRIGNLLADQVRHFYLPGEQRGVWNESALKGSGGLIILCEAIIDALTLWCAGFRNVSSAYGANGFSDEHLEAFRRHGVEHVLIAYDRDEAGDAGAVRVAERLNGAGIGAYRVHFPKGMDANEFSRKMRPVERAFRLVLRGAEHLGGPKIDLAARIELPLTTENPGPLAAPAISVPVAETAAPTTILPAPETLAAHVMEGDEVTLPIGDRKWRVRGLLKNNSADVLRVNVMVTLDGKFHVDNLDLYSSRGRKAFVEDASDQLRIGNDALKADVGTVLRTLEQLQMTRLKEAAKPKVTVPPMTVEERDAAMALLKDEALCERILRDFSKCGLVGEETNKLTAYLGCVTRKMAHPLAILVQSGSGSGKTTLMDAVLAFMPEEEREKYSAMTERALYYVGEEELSHKILGVVEEEGAERASYALKLLQSEGELMIASTAKDPQTGQLSTKSYRVKGPVMIFVTTTRIEQDEEFVNRCLVLTVDESREQTRAIHGVQREKRTVDGLFAGLDREAIRKLHQNAQRLLKPLQVVNPYVRELAFADEKTRMRRDFEKYLTLIDAVALLRQYQKPLKHESRDGRAVEYIEVESRDLQIAQELALEVLGHTLDELPAQTRKFLTLLEAQVRRVCAERQCRREEFLITRREMLDWTGWSYDQVRVHLGRLIEQEYVLVLRGARGHQYVYELLYDGGGQDGGRFVMGASELNVRTPKGSGGVLKSVGVGLGGHWGGVGAGFGNASKAENSASDRGEMPVMPVKGGNSTVPAGAGHDHRINGTPLPVP